MINSLPDFHLTEDQMYWFSERLRESSTGRVIVPSHCYVKFKRVVENDYLSNEQIKCWLIDNVYNN